MNVPGLGAADDALPQPPLVIRPADLRAPAMAAPAQRRLGGRGSRILAGAVPAAPLATPTTGYWPLAWAAGIFLVAALMVRVIELVPKLAVIRPAILSTAVLGILFWSRTSVSVIRSALHDRQVRLLAAYAAWGAFTTPFALYRSAAFKALYGFPFALFLTVALLLIAPTSRNLSRLLGGYLGSVALYCLIIAVRGLDLGNNRLTTGGMYDPNDLAGMIAMTIPFGLHYTLRTRGALRRGAAALATVVLLVVIAKTASRGGLLALVAGLLVFAAGQRWTRTVWLAPVILVLSVVFWSLAPATFRARAASILSYQEDYNMTSEVGRVEIWKRGIGYVHDHPLTGVGMDNFAEAEGRTFAQRGFVGKWFTAHNAYIQAFAELGVLGGCLFISMLWLAAKRALPFWRPAAAARHGVAHNPAIFASFAAFATSAFFLSHAYAFLFFGLMALIGFAHRVASPQPATARG